MICSKAGILGLLEVVGAGGYRLRGGKGESGGSVGRRGGEAERKRDWRIRQAGDEGRGTERKRDRRRRQAGDEDRGYRCSLSNTIEVQSLL